MNDIPYAVLKTGTYDRSKCIPGVVHLGYGAFHRAHQAYYFDKYMQATNDLDWGILAVNLRKSEAAKFAELQGKNPGYILKSTAPNGQCNYQLIRAHVGFADWTREPAKAEELLALSSVHLVTITVTESGYYLDESGKELNLSNPTISAEIAGEKPTSLYGYLATALQERANWADKPLSILCCDNIRSNGKMLQKCLLTYLEATNRTKLANWVRENVSFPCSMVDRITPRADDTLSEEIDAIFSQQNSPPVQSEEFAQWVIADDFAGKSPALARVGVQIVKDVDPYEEAKIRILNGGHSGLCYLGALAGHQTFDQAMLDPKLRAHFDGWQHENVLPGLNFELPFDKHEYCQEIAERFRSVAISDGLERICMDGWSKFPIYIRPTLQSCLEQGIDPKFGYDCIASWYVYARRVASGTAIIKYHEPYWNDLAPLLEKGQEQVFAQSTTLWDELPKKFKQFVPGIVSAIDKMEAAWPA